MTSNYFATLGRYAICMPEPSGTPGGQLARILRSGEDIGSLHKTNTLPTSPWWADEMLQKEIGEPFTFDGVFGCAAGALLAILEKRVQGNISYS